MRSIPTSPPPIYKPWDSLNLQPALAGASRPLCSASSQRSCYPSRWWASTASWHILSAAAHAKSASAWILACSEPTCSCLCSGGHASACAWSRLGIGCLARHSGVSLWRRSPRPNYSSLRLWLACGLRLDRSHHPPRPSRSHGRPHAGTSNRLKSTCLGPTENAYNN
jgi:hypothetical protein